MNFHTFVIIDPDEISCFIARNVVKACFPEAGIEIYDNTSEAIRVLSEKEEPCCIIVENTVLHLGVKALLELVKELAKKNFRVIILSNAFQKKVLSVIPKLYHVRFTYKPINKKKLIELIEEW